MKHWKSRSSRAVQEAHGEQPRESAPKFSAARVDRIDRVDSPGSGFQNFEGSLNLGEVGLSQQ